jgi:iron complex outermembrane receptor protein
MSRPAFKQVRTLLLCGCAAIAMSPALASAEPKRPVAFSIPAQDLGVSLNQFARQSDHLIVFSTDIAAGRPAPAVQGELAPEQALAMLLEGTGLTWRRQGDAYVVQGGEGSSPQSGSAAGGGAEVEALVVTAQKREEDIQDVPIAISAFTQESLDQQKIEGGFDLVKAIPNVTFSKNNFTSYNFSIRGVGTKAVSATTDPGVAVAFNNTTIIQNRLFEQEYFDLERVEVLRGPQGTLYGRNATSGVINVISAKPDLNDFDGWIKGEAGNYHTKRLSAMINVPLVEDRLAVRLAGAMTDRQGYDFNAGTGNAVNGRDLWSARLSVGFEPTERFRGNFIWEKFQEDDNRSRTGKQLCHRDDGPTSVGDEDLATHAASSDYDQAQAVLLRRALFSQGCKPGSLYEDAAFGTPNGLSYNFVLGLFSLTFAGEPLGTGLGYLPIRGLGTSNYKQTIIKVQDPYAGMMQSRDLREISSIRDPKYRAGADLAELNFDFDITDALTLSSQTAYVSDETYSFQDYNRFNTVPIFTNTSILVDSPDSDGPGEPSPWQGAIPGGIFCDPQIGCSKSIAGFDIAKAEAEQLSQELRLQSNFDSPVNFSVGANYTKFEAVIDYYVMFNLLTAMAQMTPFNGTLNGGYDPTICAYSDFWRGLMGPSDGPVPLDDPRASCPYVDPNPVESINGEGHNYFRSKNPYELESWAGFGEAYWNISDDLKLTAGLRYTDDKKTFDLVPSQVLLARNYVAGGVVSKGHPTTGQIKQHWGEWTGRLGVDWKPDLSFTDQTLLYAFYSHGYKGGGANPPKPGFATEEEGLAMLEDADTPQWVYDAFLNPESPFQFLPILRLTSAEYGDTFEPEFVDAFEFGAKNTLLGGALTLNTTAFYYDYKDYQVSQIRDRTAVNENFDATTWGLELESVFAPSRNLQIIANVGYLDTKIAEGEKSIDIMNRTQGNPDYLVVKPWAQLPSNCVVPTDVAEYWAQTRGGVGQYWELCGGVGGAIGVLIGAFGGGLLNDPATGQPYDVMDYPDINGGAGILDDVGGNELPNAPHWTANVGAQYGFDGPAGWRATVRGDVYWQSQSWARVYNSDPYDKLHGWYNANLSLWLENEEGLKIELYMKNVLNDTPITDAFLNSDDTGLTTNVFVLDPRLIGLSIRKEF